MKKNNVIALLGVLLSLISFAPFLVPLLSEKISAYLYRQNLYQTISKKQYEGDFKSLFKHVHKVVKLDNFNDSNYYDESRSPSIDVPSLDLLIYGRSWCDGAAFIFMELLCKSGNCKSRQLDLQGHTISEVLIDKKWIPIDPHFQIFFTDKNGNYLTLQEYQKLGIDNVFIPPNHLLSRDLIEKVFVENPIRYPNSRGPFLNEYYSSIEHRVIELIRRLGVFLYGDYFIHYTQDIYLNKLTPKKIGEIFPYKKIEPSSLPTDFINYYKARSYLLTSRKNLAEKFRKQINQESPWSERYDVLYERGAY